MFVLTLLVWAYCAYTGVSARCTAPDNVEEIKRNITRDIMNDVILGRTTFNIINEYRTNVFNALPIHRSHHTQNHHVLHTNIYGNNRCSSYTRRRRRHGDIRAKSTCPWYVELEIDTHREPMAMAKAKCSCTSCIDTTGDLLPGSQCETIDTFIPVIRWVCPIGRSKFRYFKDLERVPVGCTCRRRQSS